MFLSFDLARAGHSGLHKVTQVYIYGKGWQLVVLIHNCSAYWQCYFCGVIFFVDNVHG